MMFVYSIYVLVDPRTQIAFYVGKTGCPEQRIQQHMHNPRMGCETRMAALKALRIPLEMHIVAETEEDKEVGRLEGYYDRLFADGHHPGSATLRVVTYAAKRTRK